MPWDVVMCLKRCAYPAALSWWNEKGISSHLSLLERGWLWGWVSGLKDVCLGGALEWADGHGRVAKVGWSSLREIRFMQKMLCRKINIFPLWLQLVSGPVTQHTVCPSPPAMGRQCSESEGRLVEAVCLMLHWFAWKVMLELVCRPTEIPEENAK